jgi:Tfp pilus assembly protein PilF
MKSGQATVCELDVIVAIAMSGSRIEILKSMVGQDPSSAFGRYGLAMEYVNSGDLESAADQFKMLLEHNPNYSAGYFHGGQTLEKLGRIDAAKDLYQRGIEVTKASGDGHTMSELQGALAQLG